jgi:transposase-like protein
MARPVFTREFKVEAVRLIRERGVSAAQAARDLEIHENMLPALSERVERRPDAGFPWPWPGTA